MKEQIFVGVGMVAFFYTVVYVMSAMITYL